MQSPGTESAFPVTQWTEVRRLQGEGDTQGAHLALDRLCGHYWSPLYLFARRLGSSEHDAQDLTQGFFSYLLDRQLFAEADPQLGRLRTFLLTLFQRYIKDTRVHAQAQKRGGGLDHLSLDAGPDGPTPAPEPIDDLTPERLFERNWALTVAQNALRRLRTDEGLAGRAEPYAQLESFLTLNGEPAEAYETLAPRLGMAPEALRQNVSRLRRRYRESLRREIAETLRDPTETLIDEELHALHDALRAN